MKKLLLLASLACVTSACSLHKVQDYEQPAVEVPQSYSEIHQIPGARVDAPEPGARWWLAFEEPSLDEAVQIALSGNLDLRQAWNRLAQAEAVVSIQGAELYPQLGVQGSASRSSAELGSSDLSAESYIVSTGLSYELDIWRRVADTRDAAKLDYFASRQDLEATALVLSGNVVSTWFAIQETKALLELVDEQIETSEALLRLTEARFTTGGGSALDVIQQRQQLESARSEIPVIQARLENLRHRLAILLGYAPKRSMDQILAREPGEQLPELPAFPSLVKPADLLLTRPDLRAARLRLQSADHEVAAAVADRLPRLSISFDYDFRAVDASELLQSEFLSLSGGLIAPLIDGGRRRAEVRRRKAIVDERLNAFGQTYLGALGEIEDALVSERYQLELITKLQGQVELGEVSLRQSRLRYVNGLVDYLSVLAAVQSLQDLERRLILEQRTLLENRATLYRAMGGAWGEVLESPPLAATCNPPSTETIEGDPRCSS